ncbi:glycoside hydrolase family 3 N-terminal domain-containing protein [Leifsonia sp. NPDC058248]|uniref:glycoside hydrolase family 3 N-terminal domain-containing protein n=1 Tax=Leifsonia sp. NPDC058248 TaxID=3346402 RepID=UPI0036DFA1CB
MKRLPDARVRARAATVVAIALAAVLLVSGCAPSGVRSTPPPATASATPTAPADPVTAFARERLSTMTLRQKVASLFMLHQPGTDGVALRAFIDRYGLGGMILMGDNIPATPAALTNQTAAMTSDTALPPLIAIDEEGGEVVRLPWDRLPGADVLKSRPAAETRAAFAQRGALLKQAGVNVNFGTVADVTADPESFIYDRVLGSTTADASARVAASVAGEAGETLSTLKHFPGHGETEADSHLTVPATQTPLATWKTRDAPTFAAGIRSGAQVVMFGHLAYSAVDREPASLSAAWHRILRQQLGFDGVTITDDMRMLQDTGLPEYRDPAENAVRALAAGNTMLLFVLPADPEAAGMDPDTLIDAVVAAVGSGRITAAQIDADALELLELRRSLAEER